MDLIILYKSFEKLKRKQETYFVENQKRKRNSNHNFSEVDENYNFIRSTKIFIQEKHEENCIKVRYNQIALKK